MKNRLFTKALIVLTLVFNLLFLTQCDLILGSGERANVLIDLGGFYGDAGRKIVNLPPGIVITRFTISVFGPGMRPIEQTIQAPARGINLQVPPGEDRYFTLEAHFDIFDQQFYAYHNLRSYKGRLVADLRPGRTANLRFSMSAGATQLLAPDRLRTRIHRADDLPGFAGGAFGTMGPLAGVVPADLDIAADGRVFMANDAAAPSIVYGDHIDVRNGTLTAGTNTRAVAMDRDCLADMMDVTGMPVVATNLLYSTTSQDLYYSILEQETGVPNMQPVQMTFNPGANYYIRGLSVDPWTHLLYIVGYYQFNDLIRIPFIIRYNPFYFSGQQYGQILNPVYLHTSPGSFQDVIVKDDRIFVLNNVNLDDLTTPVLLVYDKNLTYLGGFGRISSNGTQYVASTAPGMFYHPKRFIAHENRGLFILDDSNLIQGGDDVDKIVSIGTDLDPAGWRTFPGSPGAVDPFQFFEN